MTNAFSRWEAFWFSPGSSFDLAFLRLAAVALQCFILLSYSFPSITYALSLPDYLWNPQLILKVLSLQLGGLPLPESSTILALFWLTFLFGILSFLGVLTNASLIIFAIGNILLQAFIYSFDDIHHPEAILLLGFVVLACSPSGRVLSVDAWLRGRRGSSAEASIALLDLEDRYAGWPIRFLQWFYPLMYLSAVVSKLTRGGLEWANGISLQYYMILEGFKSESPLALYLSEFHHFLRFAEYIVLLFQATFFLILFFPRLKWIYLPLGICFHIIIYVTLRAPFPQWIVLYMIYIPWASVFKWLAAKRVPAALVHDRT